MSTREYIGARYVPIFGRKDENTIAWDNTAPYEPLTVVLYQGNSYTSRQYVPAGIDIDNEEYWAETGNYNAQIEVYREEVSNVAEDVAELQAITPINDIILIGDSFVDGTLDGTTFVASWVSWLDNALPNSTIYDYSDTGSGYVRAGIRNQTTYMQQAAQAIQNIDDKDSVSDIVVFGGVNDLAVQSLDMNQIMTCVKNIVEQLCTAFQNATVHIVGPDAGMAQLNGSGYTTNRDYKNYMTIGFRQAKGRKTYTDASKWLYYAEETYSADKLHPSNAKGNQIMFTNIMCVLTGSDGYALQICKLNKPSSYTYANTFIEEIVDSMCRFETSNGKIDIPPSFVQITADNYFAANVGSRYEIATSQYFGIAGKNPIVPVIGYSLYDGKIFIFRILFQAGVIRMEILSESTFPTLEEITSTQMLIVFQGFNGSLPDKLSN